MARQVPNLNAAFGKVLNRYRTEKGISQEKLAHECDLHRTYISMLERGLKSPSLNTIAALARALKTPAHELVRATEHLTSS